MKTNIVIILIFFMGYTINAMQSDEIKNDSSHEHVFGLITETYEEPTIYPEFVDKADSPKIHNLIYRSSIFFKELDKKYNFQDENEQKK